MFTFQIIKDLSNTAVPPKQVDIGTILQQWRQRLPNKWEDILVWSDLLSWRQAVFQVLSSAFNANDVSHLLTIP